MTTWNWTQVTLTGLIVATLSGCAVPGRFSRDQYMAMDSDPFLEDSDSMIAKSDDVVQVRPTSVPEVKGRPGTMPKTATGSDCDSGAACHTSQVAHARNSQHTLANLFEVEEQPKKILQVAAETTTEVRDEFDSFMKTQQDRVVHAVAEVRETAETSGENFREQLEDDAFWGFPEDNPANTAPTPASTKVHPFSGSEATPDNHNPFSENSSEPTVAPPADVFGDSSANDAFPPGDFEFN